MKENDVEQLVKELLCVLKKGNVTLEEVVKSPSILLTHPDFDKAIDILAALEDLLVKNEI
jgi:hypothetical protein